MGRRGAVFAQVLELMRSEDRHCWTLEDVQAGLASRGLDPDPSSVFRAVTRLQDAGRVVRVPIDDRRSHYEIAGGHHDHLVCERCSQVEPLACSVLRALSDDVRRRSGFVVSDHRLVLTGTCRNCFEGIR